MQKRTLDLGGPVHVADFGGAGVPIVLVHGLGGSYTNWMAVGGALAARGRVLAPDLIGFGRTPPGGRSSSVAANLTLLGRLLHTLGAPAILVGNSMGGLLSLLLAARRPEAVAGLVLVGPALPRSRQGSTDLKVAALFTLYAIPGVGEMFMRRRLAAAGPERVLRDTLRLCGADPAALDPAVWDEALALAHERARYPWANGAFLGAARSMLFTLARRGRVDEAIRKVRAPTLITQGSEDRLVPVEISEAAIHLRPDWRLELMPGTGHVPQLSHPARWLSLVTGWLDAVRPA